MVFKVTVETDASERGENLNCNKIIVLSLKRTIDKRRKRRETPDTNATLLNPRMQHFAALSVNNKPKKDLICTQCGRNGHEKEKCWKLIGYPNDRKCKIKREEESTGSGGDANAAKESIPFNFVGSLAVRSQPNKHSKAVTTKAFCTNERKA